MSQTTDEPRIGSVILLGVCLVVYWLLMGAALVEVMEWLRAVVSNG